MIFDAFAKTMPEAEIAFDLPTYPSEIFRRSQGIGLTSQRVRDRMVARLMKQKLSDERVINVMRVTPRHLFVDEALASRAYEDTALPIGYGQTISQPWVVAMMTQALLKQNSPKRVLEIGTGSGYQTAILAQLVAEVWTVERICRLQDRAMQTLNQLQFHNIHQRCSTAILGWPEVGKFDAILSAAAPETLPDSLIDQLAIGGRLVMPVGTDVQDLVVIDKTKRGIERHSLGEVMFVPLIHQSSC
jgi:protein-L-isoaspartate(D-aspartate) O-methyltransferase